MKIIRKILKSISALMSIIGMIVLFVLCMKTLMFDHYNPRDAVITFIHIQTIAGTILLIRWLLKPEYKWELSQSNDFGTICSICYNGMSNCICHKDDYVPETHITEEMFNEIIDEISYDDKNDEM